MKCGTTETHCCWLGKFGQCVYVEPADEPPRKWRCRIRAEHTSWVDTHRDSRYLNEIRPKLREIGIAVDCGDWPQSIPGMKCNECGEGYN